MPLPSSKTSSAAATIPPELASEGALLAYLGLAAGELRKIWWFREGMYTRFQIAKAGGNNRSISAPNDRLKYLQRQLAKLLDLLYPVRNSVHGFVLGKSVKTNAAAHLRKRYILNVDLKNFFPSITEGRVKGLLEAVGLDDRVASIVARLCCENSQLPLGAPTSPVLSNMVCFRMDRQMLAFAKGARCTYTRYADDITFSGHQPMMALFEGAPPPAGRFSPDLLAPSLSNLFLQNGFTINADKAHYADRHSRRMVTGLKINEVVNVDRSFVRNLRSALFSVEKLGVKGAQEKYEKQYGGKVEISNYLAGKIAWLRMVKGQSDPVFRAIAVRFNTSFPSHKVELSPTVSEIRDRSVWIVEHADDHFMHQGSAFFLKGVGLVTAAHCVEGVEEVEIYNPMKISNKFKAKVSKRDKVRDLAVLENKV